MERRFCITLKGKFEILSFISKKDDIIAICKTRYGSLRPIKISNISMEIEEWEDKNYNILSLTKEDNLYSNNRNKYSEKETLENGYFIMRNHGIITDEFSDESSRESLMFDYNLLLDCNNPDKGEFDVVLFDQRLMSEHNYNDTGFYWGYKPQTITSEKANYNYAKTKRFFNYIKKCKPNIKVVLI